MLSSVSCNSLSTSAFLLNLNARVRTFRKQSILIELKKRKYRECCSHLRFNKSSGFCRLSAFTLRLSFPAVSLSLHSHPSELKATPKRQAQNGTRPCERIRTKIKSQPFRDASSTPREVLFRQGEPEQKPRGKKLTSRSKRASQKARIDCSRHVLLLGPCFCRAAVVFIFSARAASRDTRSNSGNSRSNSGEPQLRCTGPEAARQTWPSVSNRRR